MTTPTKLHSQDSLFPDNPAQTPGGPGHLCPVVEFLPPSSPSFWSQPSVQGTITSHIEIMYRTFLLEKKNVLQIFTAEFIFILPLKYVLT